MVWRPFSNFRAPQNLDTRLCKSSYDLPTSAAAEGEEEKECINVGWNVKVRGSSRNLGAPERAMASGA